MENGTGIIWLIACFILLSAGALLYGMVWLPYKNERDYITMEIKRSDKEEKKYWVEKRRKLYKKYIFVGQKQAKKGRGEE